MPQARVPAGPPPPERAPGGAPRVCSIRPGLGSAGGRPMSRFRPLRHPTVRRHQHGRLGHARSRSGMPAGARSWPGSGAAQPTKALLTAESDHLAISSVPCAGRVGASSRECPAIQARQGGCPSRIRTSPNGFKVRCPTTRRRGSAHAVAYRREGGGHRAAGAGAKKWSGRRDSNPRPSPWQGDALPTEPLPLGSCAPPGCWCREPESNWRHRDFQSRALPTELSRPGETVVPLTARRRAEG